jgi:hypothetical protein
MKNPIINTETNFYRDLTSRAIKINGQDTPLGYYNLIVSIRDCCMYSLGIKPHRNWKITDIKKYFGIKGNPAQLTIQLQQIKKTLLEK